MKKALSLIGMIGGIALIIVGVVVMCGVLGGETSTPSSAVFYDSGYASFGADFYTYVTNNAAEAASASRTAANNLDAVAELLKNVCGLVFVAFGLFMTCFFGIVFADQKNAAQVPAAVEAPTPEPAPEPGTADVHAAERAEE